MEKRCCICGRDFIEFGNNADPIKKGICCDYCNVRFIIPGRIFLSKNPEKVTTFEIIKTHKELNEMEKKLSERDFEKTNEIPYMRFFKNPETEENVIICTI